MIEQKKMTQGDAADMTSTISTTDTSSPTVFYAIDKTSNEYVSYVENIVGIIYQNLNNSNLCVADCEVKDEHSTLNNKVVPVICAIVEKDGNKGILPLAQIFLPEQDISGTYVPVLNGLSAEITE